MGKFLHFLQGTMKTPTWMGWFHILCLVIGVVLCLLIYVHRHKFTRSMINLILLITGICLILFEVYKLIVLSFNYRPDGKSYWKFPWSYFPFQFCSTPMYVMLLAGILRKGKVYEACTGYLATFSMFAGGFVYLIPGACFCKYIGINIQTMAVHGGMFIIAFMLLVTRSVEHNLKSVFKASMVFVCTLTMALIMNILFHYFGNGEQFNMFYISPYVSSAVPVLGSLHKILPFAIYFLLYALGFIAISTCIMTTTIALDFAADISRIKKEFPEDTTTPKIIKLLRKKWKE